MIYSIEPNAHKYFENRLQHNAALRTSENDRRTKQDFTTVEWLRWTPIVPNLSG